MKPPGHHYRISSLLDKAKTASYELSLSDKLQTPAATVHGIGGQSAIALPTAKFCRDLGLATASGGGNLVAGGVEAVAAAARPPLLLEQLGAQRVEVNQTGIVTLPKFVAGSGAWVADGSSPAAMATTTGSVDCAGKMAAARITFSRRLLLQATELESAVLAEISAAVADVIEAGFFTGDGANNQPLGLLNTSGAGTQSFAASVPTYAELVGMVETAGDADADLSRCVFLCHPSTLANLLKAQIDADGGELFVTYTDKHRIAGFPVYSTSNITEGKVIFVDPTMLRCVYWGAPQLIVDRFSSNKSLTGAAELVLFNLCDIAVLHPAQLVIGSN